MAEMSAGERAIKAIGHGVGNLIGTSMEFGGNRYARKSAFMLDPEGYAIGKGAAFAGSQLKKRIRSDKH